MTIKLEYCVITKRIISVFFTAMVAVLFAASFFTASSASAAELMDVLDSTHQLAASSSSQAINISTTEVSPGRYRIIGTLVDANNQPACGLALASGKCVFSCGPGSPRCEGGTDSLSFGKFDLTNLPTEPNGTINMQTFVSGSMPGLQVINPKGGNNTYTLSVNSTGTGTGNVTGSGSYAAGALVSLYAAATNGSTFAGWSPYPPCASSFAMPANNLTCTATFTKPTNDDSPWLRLNSPSSAQAGGQSTFSLTAQNLTGQPIKSRAAIFLSKSLTIDSRQISSTYYFYLEPGESDTWEGLITIPSTTAAGSYYLIAYVEEDDYNGGALGSAVNRITITSGGCGEGGCDIPR